MLVTVIHAHSGDVELVPQVLRRLGYPTALVQLEEGTDASGVQELPGVHLRWTRKRGSLNALHHKLTELLPDLEAMQATRILRIDPDALPVGDVLAYLEAHPADLVGCWQTSYHARPVRVIAGYCAALSMRLVRAVCTRPALHTEEATWTAVAQQCGMSIQPTPAFLHQHHVAPEQCDPSVLVLHPYRVVHRSQDA